MKRLYSILLVFSLIFLITTGCSNNKQENNNYNDNTQDTISTTSLSKNITSSGAITKQGNLVVFAINSNDSVVDMDIEVEFYDADGTSVGSDSSCLNGVGAGAEIAVEMFSTPESFDSYKIDIDVEPTTNVSYFDQVELTHNNNGEEIVVQVKNNSQDVIDYTNVSVVYYQGDEVVGFNYDLEFSTETGESSNFILYFPYDNNYDDVSFDSYKVFINEAYSFKE